MMHPSIMPLSENLTFNYPLVVKTLEELNEELSLKVFAEHTNNFNWILGHLVKGRHSLVGLAGAALEDTAYWGKLYGKGSIFDPNNSYPSLSKIEDAWVEASEVLTGVLASLGEIDILEECPFPLPIQDKTIRGGMAFLTMHECYHVGQLALLRPVAGLSSFFD